MIAVPHSIAIFKERRPKLTPGRGEVMPGSDVYNIVVVGAMNPRIHHPSWYELVGILTPEQAKEALASSATFGLPGIVQLSAPSLGLTINCTERQWTVKTENKGNIGLLQSITFRVFDELLKYTPVSAYGFNVLYQRETRCPHVGKFLAGLITESRLGLPADEADVTLRRSLGDHKGQVIIQKSPHGKGSVSLSFNHEYSTNDSLNQFFIMRERVPAQFGAALTDADEQTARILGEINTTAGA